MTPAKLWAHPASASELKLSGGQLTSPSPLRIEEEPPCVRLVSVLLERYGEQGRTYRLGRQVSSDRQRAKRVGFGDLTFELFAETRSLVGEFVNLRAQRFKLLDEARRHCGGIGDARGADERLLTDNMLD